MKLLHKSEKHELRIYSYNRHAHLGHGGKIIFKAPLYDEEEMQIFKDVYNSIVINHNEINDYFLMMPEKVK